MFNQIKKLLSKKNLIFVALLLCFSLSASVLAYPTMDAINLPANVQQMSNWCWAASSVSCIDYVEGNPPTQSQFVTTVKGSVVNATASFSEIKSGLSSYSVSSTYGYSLSFSTIISEIYNYDSPIIAGWLWSSGGGHIVVVDGYEDDTTDYVDYMDPWDGSFNYVTYSYFKGGSSYDHTWAESLRRMN